MERITDFISALGGFLLVSLLMGVFVAACVAIFRPPAWLRELAVMWRESRRTVKRVKAAGIEAEFEDREPAEISSAPEPAEATAGPAVPQRGDEPTAGSDSKFIDAIGLLQDGKYADGMALIRETVAGEVDHDKVTDRVAFGQYLGFDGGSLQALADLRATVVNNPRVVSARTWLAHALAASGEIDEALAELREALLLSTNSIEQADIASQLATLLHRSDRGSEAKGLLLSRLHEATDPPTKSRLALACAKLFDGDSAASRDHLLALHEVALQSTPTDQSILFDLAFAASKYDANGSAYLIYKRLVARDNSNALAWNNLGVAADRLQMPASAVRAYRHAESLNHALAMSNLAQLLLNAGFLDDAATLLDKARAQNKVDDHVLSVTGRLATAREGDRRRTTELKTRGEVLRKWRLRHARGLVGSLDWATLPGTYVGTNGRQFTIENASSDTLSGAFELGDSKMATFTGHIEGQLLLISWKTVQAKPPAWHSIDSGRGVLIADAPDELAGFHLLNDKVIDVDDVETWVRWSLRKIPATT